LSITGLFALVYGIIHAGEAGRTDSQVLIAFGAAAVLLSAFAWWENRELEPMLPLYFFCNLSFTGANTALAFISFSLFGSVFFMSQYLQTVLGYSAFESGVRLMPMALTLGITSIFSARIAKLIGVKFTVAIGAAIAGVGLLLMSQ